MKLLFYCDILFNVPVDKCFVIYHRGDALNGCHSTKQGYTWVAFAYKTGYDHLPTRPETEKRRTLDVKFYSMTTVT